VRIINQMTETHRVRDLARIVADLTGAEIHLVDNPRKEASANDLEVCNETILGLGLQPITLSEGLLGEITDIARVYADRCDWSKIPATARWTRPRAFAATSAEEERVRAIAGSRREAILQTH
jgi:UDP-sulfoquinovose synthase